MHNKPLPLNRVGVPVPRAIVDAVIAAAQGVYRWRADKHEDDLDRFTDWGLYPEGADWDNFRTPVCAVFVDCDGQERAICIRGILANPFEDIDTMNTPP